MSLLSRFKKPISRKWLIILTSVLVVIQFAIILAGPMFLSLASTMKNVNLWTGFMYGIAIFEMLTVPLSTLIICLLLLERFFKITPSKKKAFIYGFFTVLLISWIYFLSQVLGPQEIHYSVFLTFIYDNMVARVIYAFVNFLLSMWAYIPLLIYVFFLEILHVQGVGKNGMGIIFACIQFVSWPIWGGILGMAVSWIFGKIKAKKT
ncbi:MAG: hypothetical protein WCT53_06050 [Candidatus Gracilibacteria bacterium]|jgi:hypothetical protein